MPNPITEEALLAGLERLGAQARVPADPLAQRAAVQRALREVPPDAPDRVLLLLQHAGEAVGLRVQAVPQAPLAPLSRSDADPAHTGSHGPSDPHHPTPERRLLRLLAAEHSDVWVLVVYAAAVGLLSLVTPVAVQALVNSVAFGTVLQPVVVLTGVVLVGLSLAGLLRMLQFYVVETIQRRIFVAVSADLAWRLPRVRAEAFDREHGPELVNRFFDVLTVQKAASGLLLDGVALVLQAAIGMVLLAFYHPVFLAFDAVLIAAILFVLVGLGRGAGASSIEESRAKYAVAAWLEEIVRYPNLFKSRGAAAFVAARADDLCRRYLRARRAHFRVLARQIIGSLAFQALMSTLLLGLGAWLVIRRQLTIGQLVAAELIVSAVVAGLAKFGKHLESYYDLLAAVDKLGHLTDLPLERSGGEAAPAGPGGAAVTLAGVTYAYEDGREVLTGIDLVLAPGSRTVIVGGNGAGKTTLGELLCGLRAPSRGTMTIDGVDVQELALDSLRAQVVLVSGPEIFHGSLRENVSLGRPGAGPDQVRAALRVLGLYDDLSALPGGLEAPLPSGGPLLSSGQARRLMAARALCGRPRLIVLDAPLEGMDQAARETLLSVLFDPAAPWTLVVLTHDTETAGLGAAHYRLAGGRLTPLPQEG